ncbi:11801_t:CDS:2, partial [Gigaspora rosea]
QEPGSSPILRDKKPESSVKKGNTSKLNEKYAMMQQKMTQMAQDNETPLAGIFPHETTTRYIFHKIYLENGTSRNSLVGDGRSSLSSS